MPYFVIENRNLFNSDFGDVLIRGCAPRKDDGQLHLMRAGPFIPPAFIAGPGDHLLVSDTFKSTLESSGFVGIGFLPTAYDKIVNIPWHTWDLFADEPQVYPESGEPDDYIFDEPHDEELAQSMEKTWEVMLPQPPCNVIGDLNDRTAEFEEGCDYPHMFYGSRYAMRFATPIVDTFARDWLTANCDWLAFRPIKSKLLPSVVYPGQRNHGHDRTKR